MAAAKKDPRHERGRLSEDAAVRYLEQAGLRVLARNVRLAGAEVDIVAEELGAIVFVEVRSRSSPNFVHPFETIGWRKQHRIARVAALWLARNSGPHARARFDVVAVDWNEGRPICQLLRAAFEVSWA